MALNDTNKVHLSTIYDYYLRLQDQAYTQFAEAAQNLTSELKANLAA